MRSNPFREFIKGNADPKIPQRPQHQDRRRLRGSAIASVSVTSISSADNGSCAAVAESRSRFTSAGSPRLRAEMFVARCAPSDRAPDARSSAASRQALVMTHRSTAAPTPVCAATLANVDGGQPTRAPDAASAAVPPRRPGRRSAGRSRVGSAPRADPVPGPRAARLSATAAPPTRSPSSGRTSATGLGRGLWRHTWRRRRPAAAWRHPAPAGESRRFRCCWRYSADDRRSRTEPAASTSSRPAMLLGLLRVGSFADDDELVATESRDGVRRPGLGPQPVRDLHQQAVARVMTVGVVDGLELVEIEDHDGDGDVRS